MFVVRCLYITVYYIVHQNITHVMIDDYDSKKLSRKCLQYYGNIHWRRSALNSAGALVQGGDGEFRGFFTPYHKFSGIV